MINIIMSTLTNFMREFLIFFLIHNLKKHDVVYVNSVQCLFEDVSLKFDITSLFDILVLYDQTASVV